MQVKKSEIAKLFNKLTRGEDHVTSLWLADRRPQKDTQVHHSHGKGDLPGRVAEKVRGQLRLSRNEFKEVIECPLSLEDYLMVLRSKGLIK